MSFAQRGRALSVSGFLLAGAIGIISSTQTWLTVERADAGEAILVPGASAMVLLAPLSLAVLALGAALSISGKVVRLIFGVLAAATALFLGWSTLQLLIAEPFDAVAATVTEVTGLAGDSPSTRSWRASCRPPGRTSPSWAGRSCSSRPWSS